MTYFQKYLKMAFSLKTRFLPNDSSPKLINQKQKLTVTARFSLDLFYYLFMCVYMFLYVINCLCVYFGLGLVDFGVRRVLWSF